MRTIPTALSEVEWWHCRAQEIRTQLNYVPISLEIYGSEGCGLSATSADHQGTIMVRLLQAGPASNVSSCAAVTKVDD